MKKLASATDPLWYKDAIIYELHVRAFADSNNDGIGDFPGLISRLDYLQDLGITCIWLLPFFPSPLRDDGYDISNYTDVNPSYGTLHDFKAFLDAAHQRDMQVMIELVVNHTSDQHPWFKAARLAAPGSSEREMYVWSQTDHLYKDARIIFTDTEKSNWAWDEAAQAYYWHRFFSHQPDLNYDHPRVVEEITKAMHFWLDMGVDALRMDAIPYLCERDGTSCENLPETHTAVKKIRAAIDAEYANRLILAEANQWPADVRPYFGNGDECHMAFHFPLMPRIYMALRQEDRLPITDIMAQTPAIPDNCQWALFLRNHDELTLEMVTADERDYMYFAYSADPRMRVNVGIRRRLAPLVDNNRRRIELLNSLLLSFPGTPILYYGDEIGMGDNIYLGDRNGVRTPMQWTSDRNAGFSKCDPARLYFPVIMDPIYGYQVVNVEAQLSDQSSLLHWMQNMIALRKLFQVFGRGTLTFLNPANRRILAYLRDLNRGDGTHETVLCVANLSRFAQPVALDLSSYAGMQPVEMLGYVPFPAIADEPYVLSLAPYSFLWLELHAPELEQEGTPETTDEVAQRPEAMDLAVSGWAGFLAAEGMALLESSLPAWLAEQRWFGAKARTIAAVQVREWVELPAATEGCARSLTAGPHGEGAFSFALFYVQVKYSEGPADWYQIPLAMSMGADGNNATAGQAKSVIARFHSASGAAVVHDASIHAEFHQGLLRLIECNTTLALTSHGIARNGVTGAQVREPVPALDDVSLPPAPGSILPVAPAPLSAQPGEVSAPPRASTPASLSAGALSLQPRESPSAGNPIPLDGRLDARTSGAFSAAQYGQHLASRVGTAEQSNTSILYSDRLILKLFRRLETGESPDVEIGRYLTEHAHFKHIPPFFGEISITPARGEKTTVAMLQGFVANRGDGWEWFLEQLARFFVEVVNLAAPEPSAASFLWSGESHPHAPDCANASLQAAALLGRRTAEMHLALSSATDHEAFAPEFFTADDLAADAQRIEAQIKSNLDALKRGLPALDDALSDRAGLLLSRRPALVARARAVKDLPAAGQRIRIHGDYHLGQTLRTVGGHGDRTAASDGHDFALLDFEGEPARSLAERRCKQSPLKDVAGMMRSFSYAASSALDRFRGARNQSEPGATGSLEGWARFWQSAACDEFLMAYREAVATNPMLLPTPETAQELLEAYLLEKALYELLYELNHRPGWLGIPIGGILSL